MSPETSSKKEIKERDNCACKWPGCNRGNTNGYHIQVAHLPDHHGSNLACHQRVLCTAHHILEELLRGNTFGAKRLYMGHTIRHYDWIFSNTGRDEKPPFGWFIMAAANYKSRGIDLVISDYVEA